MLGKTTIVVNKNGIKWREQIENRMRNVRERGVFRAKEGKKRAEVLLIVFPQERNVEKKTLSLSAQRDTTGGLERKV